MIQVVGNSAKKVDLRDLGDVVFFKQQKSFSNADYERSEDLKTEIAKGRLIVLRRTDDVRPTNDSESFSIGEDTKVPAPMENPILDSLIAKVNTLEGSRTSSTPMVDSSLLETLVSILEGKMETHMGSLRDSLETKLFKADSDLFNKKIDELIELVKSGASVPQTSRDGRSSSPREVTPKTIDSFVDEVYVPSIRVEDGNANINLRTRVIEGGSSLSSSLDALKSLKR